MLSPFMKAQSHYYVDDAWTSNAFHGHNFHRRDLKFSDDVLQFCLATLQSSACEATTLPMWPLRVWNIIHCCYSLTHTYSYSWNIVKYHETFKHLPFNATIWPLNAVISALSAAILEPSVELPAISQLQCWYNSADV